MGQTPSTHHEPLERGAAARRSVKHQKAKEAASPRRMDRLRRSFRDSFRRRKEHVPESSKPHQWQADEASVRAGTCSFHVKYLGCVEVFESRGMQVCEEALKVLRNSRRRPVKAVLYVSGDGLRVVEDETKGLIVDQTIEKVSFCAPDRNHEKGFSYICRDGTTRRWMCHGFLALKESGERLSHAVGCAFAACLERKQKRDKECGVTMTFDAKNSTFTRTGSFRQASITERLQDPQELKPSVDRYGNAAEPPVVKPVVNPYAIERPHATASMLQRQGSFRGFQQLNQASPFKRQMSLRISDLPSTLERQRSLSLEGSDFRLPPIHMKPPVSPIPEASPLSDKVGDSVSAMCQQLAQGLSLLSSSDDFLPPTSISTQNSSAVKQLFPASSSVKASTGTDLKLEPLAAISGGNISSSGTATTSATAASAAASSVNTRSINTLGMKTPAPKSSAGALSISSGAVTVSGGNWIPSNMPSSAVPVPPPSWGSPSLTSRTAQAPPLASAATSTGIVGGAVTPVPVVSSELPQPDQWLGSVVNSTVGSMSPSSFARRAPPLSQHLRAHSLSSAEPFLSHHNANGQPALPAHPAVGHALGHDPFDAEWAAIAARNQQQNHTPAPIPTSVAVKSTNPFISTSVKAFEVHM